MRYLITFEYDGNNYYGYQKQKDKATIQEEIELKISKLLNITTKIYASGRTDSSVHAINQKAHFDSIVDLDQKKFLHSLNSIINEDIYIKSIISVNNNFHARFNIKKKEYEYRINVGEYNPFQRNYTLQYNKELNINLINEALSHICGKHNFKSFAKSSSDVDINFDFVRTVYEANAKKIKDTIFINITGDGFLRYMVRNIVGLLIEVGSGKKNITEVINIINAHDRKKAGITAPPHGLYLKNVKY